MRVLLDGTNRSLGKLYRMFNRCYFNDKLDRDVEVKFGKTGPSVWGQFTTERESYYIDDRELFKTEKLIMLNPLLKKSRRFTCLVLLHEMCHVATPGKSHHGREFKKQILRLFKAGAYDALL